jgi:hypothetical protein
MLEDNCEVCEVLCEVNDDVSLSFHGRSGVTHLICFCDPLSIYALGRT